MQFRKFLFTISSLEWILHSLYQGCVFSKIWRELGFVHYIKYFTISRFTISRLGCTIKFNLFYKYTKNTAKIIHFMIPMLSYNYYLSETHMCTSSEKNVQNVCHKSPNLPKWGTQKLMISVPAYLSNRLC